MTRLVIALLLCTLLVSWASPGPWPNQRPADFTVELSESGGMLPRGMSATTVGTWGAYAQHERLEYTSFLFTVTPTEMDALYNVLRINRLDNIRVGEGIIYDKGGPSLYANWGQQRVGLATSGREVIDIHQNRWKTMVQATQKLLEEKRKLATKTVTIELGSSLAGKQVTILAAGERVFHGPVSQARKVQLKAMPGTYELEVKAVPYGMGFPEVSTRVRATAGNNIRIDFKEKQLVVN